MRLLIVMQQADRVAFGQHKGEAFARFFHSLYTRTHRAIAVPRRHMIRIVAEEMHSRVGKLQGSGAT